MNAHWLGRALSSLLVFGSLGGLAWWGHHTGWKMPSLAALRGDAALAPEDWCAAHNVPESICVECQTELMPRPKSYGWCFTHGVHDCPLCHPEVAQLTKPATVTAEDLARAQRALRLTDRPVNNSKCKLHERRIQFVSIDAMRRAGVNEDPVELKPMVETIAANGEVNYDPTRVARLSSRLPGTIWRVEKQVGEPVLQGDVLALVESAEVGRAKAEFLQALVQVQLKTRNQESYLRGSASGSIPERQLREAETALREARIRLATAEQSLINLGLPVESDALRDVPEGQLTTRLQFLGLPDALARSLPRQTTGNLLPIKAPLAGVVVGREVVAGEVVDTARALFVVADNSRMWLTLDVRSEDARSIRLDQSVRFQPEGSKVEVSGQIAWISTEVDHKTRALKVRATLPNSDGQLRANTFGTGRITLREEPAAVVVKNEAIHWEGDCYIVFVRDRNFVKEGSPKVFHTRTVRIGTRNQEFTEIIAGVLPGEWVATQGSAVLKAELLRGSLGEG